MLCSRNIFFTCRKGDRSIFGPRFAYKVLYAYKKGCRECNKPATMCSPFTRLGASVKAPCTRKVGEETRSRLSIAGEASSLVFFAHPFLDPRRCSFFQGGRARNTDSTLRTFGLKSFRCSFIARWFTKGGRHAIEGRLRLNKRRRRPRLLQQAACRMLRFSRKPCQPTPRTSP